jgi:hypothetical protein
MRATKRLAGHGVKRRDAGGMERFEYAGRRFVGAGPGGAGLQPGLGTQ